MWQLAGVDCSGLLYEATNGFTPRNTFSLVEYGRSVPIAGLDPVKIVERLEPLDLIVWSGHVMIVLDRERLIESRLDSGGKGGGVRVRPLREALAELMKGRVPLDDYKAVTANWEKGFVIRRWYPAGTTVLNRAASFTWRGVRTTAMLLETIYEKGIKLCGKEKEALENRLLRSSELHWWDIAIPPIMV
jgi:hypothetical protein